MGKLNFILQAKQNCYAAKKESLTLIDQGKVTNFDNDEFLYVDTYYGYNPFAGQEVVFKKYLEAAVPIWYMNYGGTCLDLVNPSVAEGIYKVLRGALLKVDKYHPFRGPSEFISGSYIYKSKFTGGFDNFAGTEEIYFCGFLVYRGNYFGGMLQLKEMLDIGI